MNARLSVLADVCRGRLFQEKILVVPSLVAGYQLLESLSTAGQPWLNVRPVTPYDLARDVAAAELFRQEVSILSPGETLGLVEEALLQAMAGGELVYFAALQEQGELARILQGTVQELRLAGISALGIDPRAFVSGQKGKEIKRLLCLYEGNLRRRGLADQAVVFRTALQVAGRGQSPFNRSLFLIPAEMEFAPLAYSFLTKLSEGRRFVLSGEPVLGLACPAGCRFQAESAAAPVSPFSLLYAPAETAEAAETEIFRAYGPANEVREVFRRLKKENISLDRVVLVYTAAETYLPLIYTLVAHLGCAATFAEGLPLTYTQPGRLALQLLRWLEEDYATAVLYRTITGGDFCLPSPDLSARLLREAQIGWGRERYLPMLDAFALRLAAAAEAAEKAGEERRAAGLRERHVQVLALRSKLAMLLDALPPVGEDGRVSFPAFAKGLSVALSVFARQTSEVDRQALEAIKGELTEAAKAYPGTLLQREAEARLRRHLGGVTVGASGAQPGSLHVTHYRQAGFDDRPYTFVVGLSACLFPGGGLQDPVLLDDERRSLCGHLPMRRDAAADNTYAMASLLASHRGRLTLSFSCQDVTAVRPRYPAGLLLQAFRLKTADPVADYSRMLDELPLVTYLPDELGESVSVDEWWLSGVLGKTFSGDLESVAACYPRLAQGLASAAARSMPHLTAYDGLVTAAHTALEQRQDRIPVFSATQLEKLAHCPFAYFLSYVLGVRPPAELSYDPATWLDSLSRGALLHQIYCRYLRACCSLGVKPPPDKGLLFELAGEMMERKKDEIPPPSELIYAYEREQLLRGLDVFWRVEEAHGSFPAYFEVPFGGATAEIAAAGIGLTEPVEISLPGGKKIALRGRIDRIDRAGEHVYEVWDFKVGSAYGYSQRACLAQGRRLQHVLYSLAAEAVLHGSGADKKAQVQAGGYLFSTEKGEGQRFSWSSTCRGRALEAVEKALDLLAGGIFCASHDVDRCTYCEYKSICRAPSMGEKIKKCLDLPELAPWKELQEYE